MLAAFQAGRSVDVGEREPARALREGDPGRGVQPLAEQLALVSASRLALQAVACFWLYSHRFLQVILILQSVAYKII